MIMKKSGLVIAAAAAAIFLSGCATSARNMPENMPMCETPCAVQNTCKCMSQCKQMCHTKHKMRRHRHRCRTAENVTTQTAQTS